ncbi:MAG: acetolactate synthase small subunit [Firmicutes bacterium HGW-Firmicutes-1]|jgi:acetolactate synthase-1/3 small subunit|nr:MAG: acetolactate synthase small subunit [Firmicutes bacterium HGW-Firmicutes-1]
MKKQIFSIWVENQAGVLSRVAAIFGETGLNIDSLAVGTTENSQVSRITIVTEGEEDSLDHVISKMNEITNLIKVKKITEGLSVLRELALIMVEAPEAKRQDILTLAEIFRAEIVDVGIRTMTIEISGGEDKIQAMEDLLRPFGIREIVRTGTIAIDRTNRQ